VVLALVTARLQLKVTKARRPVPAVALSLVLKAVRCRFNVACPSVVLDRLIGMSMCLINLQQLDVFEAGSCVDRDAMNAKGLLKKSNLPVKVLANGDITKALTVKADKFSKSAIEKIQAVGGKIEDTSAC
jgi:hypothetical protein